MKVACLCAILFADMAQQVEHVLGKEYRDEKWVSRNPSKFGKKLHLLIWLSR